MRENAPEFKSNLRLQGFAVQAIHYADAYPVGLFEDSTLLDLCAIYAKLVAIMTKNNTQQARRMCICGECL